jgi:formate hydrogenlyase subunit 3/multisubunit Na+/H+ antiporter MnhD subunit
MKEILQRFMYLFHWVGFICLALFILVGVLSIVLDSGRWLQGEVTYILEFDPHSTTTILHILWVWLAVTHYPIKWIITGNKTFYPWKSGV